MYCRQYLLAAGCTKGEWCYSINGDVFQTFLKVFSDRENSD